MWIFFGTLAFALYRLHEHYDNPEAYPNTWFAPEGWVPPPNWNPPCTWHQPANYQRPSPPLDGHPHFLPWHTCSEGKRTNVKLWPKLGDFKAKRHPSKYRFSDFQPSREIYQPTKGEKKLMHAPRTPSGMTDRATASDPDMELVSWEHNNGARRMSAPLNTIEGLRPGDSTSPSPDKTLASWEHSNGARRMSAPLSCIPGLQSDDDLPAVRPVRSATCQPPKRS